MSPRRGRGRRVADRVSRAVPASRVEVRATVFALALAALIAAPTPVSAQTTNDGVVVVVSGPFADRTALKAAVDACLAAVPSGERCCSEAGADCGVAGAADMPDWDVSQVDDMSLLFDGYANFNEPIGKWDTRSVRNMNKMFYNAAAFNQDIGDWDTSRVIAMSSTFQGATSFNADIGKWDTSRVLNMYGVFHTATSFNQDISDWDTSQVTAMNDMFRAAASFNRDIRNWDTSKVNGWANMFGGASAWNARYVECGCTNCGPVTHDACTSPGVTFGASTWDAGGSLTAWVRKEDACDASKPPVDGFFGDCTDTLPSGSTCQPTCDEGFTPSGPTSCVDRALVPTTCVGRPCDASVPVENGGLGGCDDTQLADKSSCVPTCNAGYVLHGARTCADGTLIDGAVCRSPPLLAVRDAVKNCLDAVPSGEACCSTDPNCANPSLARCGAAGCVDMPAWDISQITDAASLFMIFYNRAEFNQPIGRWDTSKVTSLGAAFSGAAAFNQPIGDWDTSQVASMAGMFQNAAAFNQPIGDWDTSKVTYMFNMFKGAAAFNQPIGKWYTPEVTRMDSMFQNATAFNQPIGDWYVPKVTRMDSMFFNATAFNADITGWKTPALTDSTDMFAGATAWRAWYHRPDQNSTNTSSATDTAVDDGPPNAWTATYRRCDRPPAFITHAGQVVGKVGDCAGGGAGTIPHGSSCAVECNAREGYHPQSQSQKNQIGGDASGSAQCVDGDLVGAGCACAGGSPRRWHGDLACQRRGRGAHVPSSFDEL